MGRFWNMFSSILYRARSWPAAWRSRLLFYWYTRERSGGLGFVAMLGLPILALGSIVYFARADGLRIAATQQRHALAASAQREADLRCLAENVYFEARGEPMTGQYAVAEVTLNRLASPHFPKTICDVVHEAHWDSLRKRRVAAFSWTELKVRREPRGRAWREAVSAATAVYDDVHTPVVPDALFYHATYIDPYWAKTKKPVGTIGNHAFYR